MNKETKRKILTCVIGTVFTLSFCFLFEGKSVMTQAKPENAVFLPVITYKNISAKENGYTVTREQFEKDLAFLKEKGYNSVVARDLVSFTMGLSELPENPVLITFDGGYRSFLTEAFPILEKYNTKAVVNIVGEYTDIFSKDVPKEDKNVRLCWEEVKYLHYSPFVEIGNNSYSFYDENKNPTKTQVKEDVLRLQQLMAENIYNISLVFSYPHGFYSKETEKVINELGFKVTLLETEGKNYITKDKRSLFNLKRYERKASDNTAEFFEKIM